MGAAWSTSESPFRKGCKMCRICSVVTHDCSLRQLSGWYMVIGVTYFDSGHLVLQQIHHEAIRLDAASFLHSSEETQFGFLQSESSFWCFKGAAEHFQSQRNIPEL